jgi:curved DNA-binding protein CbpA
MATDLAPTEITALAGILGELDYYQLLHLAPDAKPSEIKRAYHTTSRTFHPDSNRFQNPEIRQAIDEIAKRISEAYSILRNPRRRKAYDHQVATKAGVRMQLAEAEAAGSRKQTEAREGRTTQGRQYFNLASASLRQVDFASAVRNLQTAITFEPDNDFFKEQLAEARKKLNAKSP